MLDLSACHRQWTFGGGQQGQLIDTVVIDTVTPSWTAHISSKGSDPSGYVLLYMFASYHLPPQQFYRAHASSYQPTTQSPSFPSQYFPAHTSHIPPALLQPSPSPDLILYSTSDIQSSLSLLPSLASPPPDDSAPSSSASSSSMLGRSLLSSFGNAWLNS